MKAIIACCIFLIGALGYIEPASAQNGFQVYNNTKGKCVFFIKNSQNPIWHQVEVPPGQQAGVTIISRGSFDLACIWYSLDGLAREFRTNGVKLTQLMTEVPSSDFPFVFNIQFAATRVLRSENNSWVEIPNDPNKPLQVCPWAAVVLRGTAYMTLTQQCEPVAVVTPELYPLPKPIPREPKDPPTGPTVPTAPKNPKGGVSHDSNHSLHSILANRN